MILLDTCGLLALQAGGKDFSAEARARLEAPGSEVFVSAITAFEIGQKHASGKLIMNELPGIWFPAMLRQHYLTELTVSSSILLAAAALPSIHRDPFDRILIATAIAGSLTILTSDRIIPTYPGIDVLW
ncbi:MAG: type II toxin-antitoxin system VapC family toxin [Verrucomicrobiota bacterium]